jgi:hypothetical protein
MKIQPLLYNDLFVRYDCLLAFSDTVDLSDDRETRNRIESFHKSDALINKDHKFYLIKNKRKGGLENFQFTDFNLVKDYVYLNSESKTY